MKDEVIVSQADLTAEEEHLMKAEVVEAINMDEPVVKIKPDQINMTGLATEGGLKDGKD